MAEIVTAKLSTIDANPLRRLDAYPYNAEKIAALRQSIRDVGLWEGVIGRAAGNRIQIAFGHHRIEAARQEFGERATIAIIVRDLTDEQMLQFMGRENLEDYNAEFLAMLEAWEAARQFLRGDLPTNVEMIEVATLLGWVTNDGRSRDVAKACANALELIDAKHVTRKQLAGLAVWSVRELCQHVVARQRQLESVAKQTGRSATEVAHAKRDLGRAVGEVARGIRAGHVAQRDIRGEVDATAYRHAKEAKRSAPLFAKFADNLAESISNMIRKDSAVERLREIKAMLGKIEMKEDVQSIKRIASELSLLSERADDWAAKLKDPKTKVIPLRSIGR